MALPSPPTRRMWHSSAVLFSRIRRSPRARSAPRNSAGTRSARAAGAARPMLPAIRHRATRFSGAQDLSRGAGPGTSPIDTGDLEKGFTSGPLDQAQHVVFEHLAADHLAQALLAVDHTGHRRCPACRLSAACSGQLVHADVETSDRAAPGSVRTGLVLGVMRHAQHPQREAARGTMQLLHMLVVSRAERAGGGKEHHHAGLRCRRRAASYGLPSSSVHLGPAHDARPGEGRVFGQRGLRCRAGSPPGTAAALRGQPARVGAARKPASCCASR
jgi:hypothetical protein